MDPAVQAYKDKAAEKAAAKERTMEALGEAKLAEYEGREGDAGEAWAVVEEQGMSGVEGACHLELQAMADAYVTAHPEKFALFEQYANPDGQVELVKLITVLRGNGMEEQALQLDMFERHHFQRQQIGGSTKAKMRVGAGKGD